MTVQFRLTIRIISVMLIAGVIFAAVTVYHIASVLLNEVQDRVSLDLNAARAVYDGHADRIELFLKAAALDPTLSALLTRGAEARDRLRRMREVGGMDRLCLLDLDCEVVAGSADSSMAGWNLADNAVVSNALRRRSAVAGTVLVPALEGEAQLRVTHPGLLEQEPVELNGTVMAMAAAAPVYDESGRIVGLLYGADILNDQHNLVDSIRAEVFRYRAWKGIHIGTATIFQDNVRISTNIRRTDGRRALGTQMADHVREEVLNRGNSFAAPAYEVNDWYFTAYEPIRDPDGRIVGALHVGLLQTPFVEARNSTIATFLGILITASVIILVLLIAATRQVLRPIERIVAMTGRVAGGDLTARVGIRPAGEMGMLCAAVDKMAEAVSEREAQLEQATRRQLSQSEKLASIGRLAAGIAHEVNNPLTGVLTFTHLLRGKANLDDQDRADLDLVIRETTRVRNIVRGLLDFARESPTRKEWVDVNQVLRRATWLLRNQKEFRTIAIEERLNDDLPRVYADQNQLQQVFLNLSLNACEAMHQGGTLTITTTAREGEVMIRFVDTGQGIPSEDLEKIFEPFYTTKPVGKGTGLGLSVSYGIIQQNAGTLSVKSEPGKGTTFTITFPTSPPAEKPDSPEA